MLDIAQPSAVLEINSWLPELNRGEKRLTLNGLELPCEVGATLPGSVRALCVSPGRWVLVSEEHSPAAIVERVAAEVAGQGAVLIDTTDGIGVANVRGPLARDVLSKGCGLDFHPSAFAVGRCARTRFAQMAVLIEHIDDASFRLYVARSYLRFLTDWIADASIEFQSSP
jgi:sarcosine oxidase subunit gamma